MEALYVMSRGLEALRALDRRAADDEQRDHADDERAGEPNGVELINLLLRDREAVGLELRLHVSIVLEDGASGEAEQQHKRGGGREELILCAAESKNRGPSERATQPPPRPWLRLALWGVRAGRCTASTIAAGRGRSG